MKPRFIKEYANWKYSVYYNHLDSQHEAVRIVINKCLERIQKIPSLYERGFINVDEAMKMLTNIDNYYNKQYDELTGGYNESI